MPTEGLVRLPDELHPVGSLQRGCFGETGLGSSLQQQTKHVLQVQGPSVMKPAQGSTSSIVPISKLPGLMLNSG